MGCTLFDPQAVAFAVAVAVVFAVAVAVAIVFAVAYSMLVIPVGNLLLPLFLPLSLPVLLFVIPQRSGGICFDDYWDYSGTDEKRQRRVLYQHGAQPHEGSGGENRGLKARPIGPRPCIRSILGLAA